MAYYLKIISFSFLLIMSISCKQTQNIQSTTPTYSETKQNYELLSGDWRLTGYSAFMSAEDMEKIPDFSSLKVIYTIARSDYKLTVTREQEKEDKDFALAAGEYRIWANHSMVKIGSSLYMYRIEGNTLTLDSNYDPSIGPDGIVYKFVRN